MERDSVPLGKGILEFAREIRVGVHTHVLAPYGAVFAIA